MEKKIKKEEKIIDGKYAHIFECDICYEMERRGYRKEADYWDDAFAHKLKPIKYKLIMRVDKKTFDKWVVCLHPEDYKLI